MRIYSKARFSVISLTMCVFYIVSCSLPADNFDSEPESQYLSHIVQGRAETLEGLSNWYSRQPDALDIIQKTNPELGIETLRPGTEVRIPRTIVTNERPIPLDFFAGAPDENPFVLKSSDNEEIPPIPLMVSTPQSVFATPSAAAIGNSLPNSEVAPLPDPAQDVAPQNVIQLPSELQAEIESYKNADQNSLTEPILAPTIPMDIPTISAPVSIPRVAVTIPTIFRPTPPSRAADPAPTLSNARRRLLEELSKSP